MLKLGNAELAEELLELLWEESITGLALVKEDGTFWKANPAFCRITEYNEFELRRLRFQDITAPKDLKADEEMAKLVVKGEYDTYDMNKEYVTKTHKLQPVFLRVTGLRLKGEFMYFIGEVAPLDRNAQARADTGIAAAAARATFFKTVKDNLSVILFVLGGIGIMIGYATGILRVKD